ncbi:MAG: transposase [Ignavibacteria bacterium]|nr:transposase [Ignavibacteria bacterium]
MGFDLLKHHRRSIRLKGYDYSEPGIYYVTLTLQERVEFLGHLSGGKVHLSAFGEIVRDEWLRTPRIRPEVVLDEFVIMPDHLHGIIVICDERNGVTRRGEWQFAPTRVFNNQSTPFRSPSGTLGAIIRGFKGATTKQINEVRCTPGAKVWQRNYYEHIVRDEKDLRKIQHYIRENPLRLAEKHELLNSL